MRPRRGLPHSRLARHRTLQPVEGGAGRGITVFGFTRQGELEAREIGDAQVDHVSVRDGLWAGVGLSAPTGAPMEEA